LELRTLLVVANSAAFLVYGAHCLRSESMPGEFARYGLAHLRVLTGVLEVLAGIGLIVGLWWPLALRVSSAGLALLMLCALVARIRVRDTVQLWVPALTLLVVNAWILLDSLGVLG
jgi:uncharacterized membrane protein YphA (DoxX/SURF4 family)